METNILQHWHHLPDSEVFHFPRDFLKCTAFIDTVSYQVAEHWKMLIQFFEHSTVAEIHRVCRLMLAHPNLQRLCRSIQDVV